MRCCKTTREAEAVRGFDPGWADLLTRLHAMSSCDGEEPPPSWLDVGRPPSATLVARL